LFKGNFSTWYFSNI